jgi:hypothetical protein
MLGFFSGARRGDGDRVLAAAAVRLGAAGLRLAGAVQMNRPRPGGSGVDMDLEVLGAAGRVRISQYLGPAAAGCRLDPAGLARAVGLVEQALGSRPDLLIVNKFGKAEAEGRGFRPLIGQALAEGIPALVAVSRATRAAFLDFAGELGEELPAEADRLVAWALARAEAGAG